MLAPRSRASEGAGTRLGRAYAALVAAAEPAVAVAAEQAVRRVAHMIELEIGYLPVTRRGALVGIVTRGDLREAGLLDRAGGSCAACGSRDHVRRAHDVHGVGFCIDCTRKSDPPGWDEGQSDRK